MVRTVYICYGHTKEYRTVIVEGYRQYTSIHCFESLNRDVPYYLVTSGKARRHHSLRTKGAYDFVYHFVSPSEMEFNKEMEETHLLNWSLPKQINIDPVPINLYDYYEDIGYDRKKKHFNGYTLRQQILIQLKEQKFNA